MPHFGNATGAAADSQLMAGTYRLTQKLTALDSNQERRVQSPLCCRYTNSHS